MSLLDFFLINILCTIFFGGGGSNTSSILDGLATSLPPKFQVPDFHIIAAIASEMANDGDGLDLVNKCCSRAL